MRQASTAVSLLLFSVVSASAISTNDMVNVALDRPLWAVSLNNASWLVPKKAPDAPAAVFFAFTVAQKGVPPAGLEQQETNTGRSSRALPLYLAERLNLETDWKAINHNFVLKGTGPIVMTQSYDPAELATIYKKQPALTVSGHFEQDYLGLRNRLRIYIFDPKAAKTDMIVDLTSVMGEQSDLSGQAANLFFQELEKRQFCKFHEIPSRFPRPSAASLNPYIDGLGQLFMQTIVQNRYVPKETIYGEDRMLDWYLNLRKAMPTSSAPDLMYLLGVMASMDYGSKAHTPHVSELDRVLLALDDLSDPVNRVSPLYFMKRGNTNAFEQKKQQLMKITEPDYIEWLRGLNKK